MPSQKMMNRNLFSFDYNAESKAIVVHRIMNEKDRVAFTVTGVDDSKSDAIIYKLSKLLTPVTRGEEPPTVEEIASAVSPGTIGTGSSKVITL